ncbi:MAG TPA: hypothetical protein VM884_11025 [Flavisolibacter sp.]|jgi:hypothetical protein|nr:hypothetical protein [Flavisolibacter sp.]
MSKVTLKSAKRTTSISRIAIRNAVSAAYDKKANGHPSKTSSQAVIKVAAHSS